MANNRGPFPRTSFPPATRRRVLNRDGCCQQCGSTDHLEVDHVVPYAEAMRAGWPIEAIDSEDNGQALCRRCHSQKTAQEIARGRARKRDARLRPSEPHPGLIG